MIAGARPTLVLRLESPSLPAREWEITDQAMGIGRLDDADIAVPDKSVSRQHARILPTAGGFDVEDLGSTNGTWVNDKQVTDRTALANGDQLLIGDVPLRVVLRAAIPPPPPPIPPPPPPPLPESALSGGPAESAAEADPPTLIAAEPTTPPPPTFEPRPTPAHDVLPDVAFEPRPTPAHDVLPDVAFEPRPTPAHDVLPDVAVEPRPTPAHDVLSDVAVEPHPTPIPQTPPVEASTTPEDLSATNIIALADRLSAALRLLKADTAQALALFDHAGGQQAAQAFIEQSHRAEANPDNPIEQARLLDLAPTAARLLEAASTLAHAVSALHENGA
jgi:predicted component of type VI protein secretion system